MNKNFNVEGILSINCFNDDNQIDINISITPQNKFLELVNIKLDEEIKKGETEFGIREDILEGFSLLFVLNSNSKKELSKSLIDYVQLETLSSYIEDYDNVLDSVVSEEEITNVKEYVFNFLTERNKQSKLWDNYLA